jgi:hypothetical protein
MKLFTKALTAAVLALPIAMQSASSALAEAVSFRLINQSGVTMRGFYASPSWTKKWEEDILGSKVLYSGYSVRINVNDRRPDCTYDFRAVFSDGSVSERMGINICKLGSYTYY